MSNKNEYPSLKDFNILSIWVENKVNNLEKAHKDIELIYVIKGCLEVLVDTKKYILKELDFLLINSNEFHSIKSNEDNLFVIFHFDYTKLSNILNKDYLLFVCNSIERPQTRNLELRKIIEELIFTYLKHSTEFHVDFMGVAFKLISVLKAHYLINLNSHEMKSDLSSNDPHNRLSDIQIYMKNNYRNFLTLDGVASTHYLSSPYLSRIFKNKTGKTFSSYLNEIRLAHAVNDLLNTDHSITRIALDNGFPNLAAFNRVFNDYYKMKPGQYRKNQMESIKKYNNTERKMNNEKNNDALTQLREYLEKENNPVQTSVKQVVNINKLETYSRYWNQIINIGYAKDVLSSDMQEQITIMQNDIGFKYARFWGLFSDEMNVEDRSEDTITFNFNNVNKLLDFLLKNKIKPFIELGPKPKIISKSIKQSITPVQMGSERTKEEWQTLINTFLLNCLERYGVDEVENWYFEIWNPFIDPIQNYQNVSDDDSKVNLTICNDKYFDIFSSLKKDIKELVPLAKVGGCGLTLDVTDDILDSFINQWYKKKVHPDFLSVYLYPIEMGIKNQGVPKKNLQSANPDFVKNKLDKICMTLKNSGFDDLELNVTEWNISVSNRDYLNDSCYKASYIAKNILENLKESKVNMIGYWLFSDIFSDFKDSKNLLHGGAGLITTSGIKKPSYHAFVFLEKLGDVLVDVGENYIVTKKSGERYQILCYNYKHFKYSYYLHPDASVGIQEQYEIYENNDPLPFNLEIKGIPNGKYRVKEHIQNRNHGSILDEWLKFGAVTDMKQDEVDFLKQICIPDMQVNFINAEENSLLLTGNLQPHEIRLFELNLTLGK